MKALIQSKRFWAVVAAVAIQALPGVDPQVILEVTGVLSAWIIGDSLRPTVPKS